MSRTFRHWPSLFLACFLAAALCAVPAVQADPAVDLTTGRAATPRAPSPAPPRAPALGDGQVLWDLTHGVYLGYEPSNFYTDLVDMLFAEGWSVGATDVGLDNVPLGQYDIVVINLGSAWDSPYTPAEVAAVTGFVETGGGLLIMGDNPSCPNANINPVAGIFGTTCGLSDGSSPITAFDGHPIFAGVSSFTMASPGELGAGPPSYPVAWDPSSKPVVTVATAGAGRIVALGDINLWENDYLADADNARLARNVFNWLAPPELDAAPSSFELVVRAHETATDLLALGNTGGTRLEWAVSAAAGGTDILGDWWIFYDWFCDGSPGGATITFNADGTFIDSYGDGGTWTQADNRLTWLYDNGTEYDGYVAGAAVAGVSLAYNGDVGCWEMRRTIWPPAVRAESGRTAAGGPAGPDRPLPAPTQDEPASGPFDATRGGPAAVAPGPALGPAALPAVDGGRVLWDLTHGVYLGYEPAQWFSDLVTLLSGVGLTVETTTLGLDNMPLADYDVIVVNLGSAWDSPYTPAEVAAVEEFVHGGGGLLVAGDNTTCPNANINPVANAFGSTCGISNAGNDVTDWLYHPIFFPGVDSIAMIATGELAAAPPSRAVAWDAGGKALINVARPGPGRVVVMGDAGFWDNDFLANADNARLAEDVFTWLAGSWLSADPEAGSVAAHEGAEAAVAVDGEDYVRGEYGLLIVHSNDPGRALLAIPVWVDLRYPAWLPIVLREP